jgi:regulator of protease activity HflC (stomatin/prohibitin superfamily)
LQRALLTKVRPRCLELGIDVKSVNLADMVPPPDLVKQISDREIARVELDKNKTLLSTYKAEQERKAIEALKQQATEKVAAETRVKQAEIAADQSKEVELSRLKNELAIAQLRLETAREQAKKILTDGEAEAKVIHLQNEAEVAGLRKAVQGFTSAQQFAQYHVLLKLAPVLTEIFASDDSEFARIFSTYMTAPATTPSAPTTTGTTGSAVSPPDR